MQALLDAVGNIVTKDEKKAEVQNAFFASVFNAETTCSLNSQHSELEERDRERNDTPITHEEMVSDLYYTN